MPGRLSIPPSPPATLWWLVLVAGAALMLLASWVAPGLSLGVRAAYALAYVAVCVHTLAAAALVPTPRPGATVAVVAACGVVVAWLHGAAPEASAALVLTLALLTGATWLGGLVGFRIERPSHLLPVAGVSALVDAWSVFDPGGPSARLAESAARAPDQLPLFALPWPLLGTDQIVPVLGAGDLVFAALYLTALRRHALSVGRGAAAMGVALMLGLGLLYVVQRPIPMLPLMGAAVVAAEPATRALGGRDRAVFAGVMLVLGASVAYRWWW